MQQARAAAPASNSVADAWRHLADLVSITNYPAPSSRPVIPANTLPEFAASIHRAYRRGEQAFHQPSLDVEPEVPDNAGTSKCVIALCEFFWQGYRDSEKVATTKASGGGSERSPKVSKPETYSGERDKYSDFIAQLHLVFNTDKSAFSNDVARISYAGNLLCGPARKWFTPHINEENGTISFASWAQFIRRFCASFQDSDAKSSAEPQLLGMKQGTEPCTSYHARFVSYMAIFEWDEKSQIATFRRGLRDEVKDLLVGRDTPDTFDDSEYVSLCIRLDNSCTEREQDRQDSRGQTTRFSIKSDSNPGPSTAVGTHSGPMDISAGRRGPLSRKERSHRKANNLCMYCGKNGRFASTCPESSRNNMGKQRVSAAITASPTPATSSASAATTAAPNTSVLYAAAGH
jgi:hypothetical protein